MISSSPSKIALVNHPTHAQVAICGVGTAVPALQVSQEQVFQFISASFPIRDRTRELYKKTLSNDSIQQRYFALDSLEDILEQDLDQKNNRFKKGAVALGARALHEAMRDAKCGPADIDFLVVTSCTGYLCPGISSYLIEECKLRPDVHAVDMVGMGCGAAIPGVQQVHNFIKANPGKMAALVSVEICSAAMFSNDDIDIVISNTIFSDGAAAVILSDVASACIRRHPDNLLAGIPLEKKSHVQTVSTATELVICNFRSLTMPGWRDTLRFESENGHLKNVLGKDVPRQSAFALEKISKNLIRGADLELSNISHWILHAGGKKVLDEIQARFSLQKRALDSARAVLRHYGNMSSPSVVFTLAEELKSNPPVSGDWGIMASFGAGFSAHGVLLKWI